MTVETAACKQEVTSALLVAGCTLSPDGRHQHIQLIQVQLCFLPDQLQGCSTATLYTHNYSHYHYTQYPNNYGLHTHAAVQASSQCLVVFNQSAVCPLVSEHLQTKTTRFHLHL